MDKKTNGSQKIEWDKSIQNPYNKSIKNLWESNI